MDDLRLVSIFYKSSESNDYHFKELALVNLNEDNSFKILSGNYENMTNKSFDLLSGSGDFIYGDNFSLSLGESSSDYLIYFFEDEFIEEISNNKELDAFEVAVYIASKLSRIKLTLDEDVVISSKKEEDIKTYEAADVFEMLNGNLIDNIDFTDELLDETYDDEPALEESEKIDIKNIATDIEKRIVGQEEVIKELLSVIMYNQLLITELAKEEEPDFTAFDSKKLSVLLNGTAGTGKTTILNEIKDRIPFPMEIISATSMLDSNSSDNYIYYLLHSLVHQADENLDLAQRGIIVFDQFEKILMNHMAEKDLISGKHAYENEINNFMNNLKVGVEVEGKEEIFDTTFITFIISGDFSALNKNYVNNNNRRLEDKIGFNIEEEENHNIEITDYARNDVMRNFIDVIKVFSNTKTYNIEDLKTILTKSEISPIKHFEDSAKMLGYKNITYKKDLLDKIAEEAHQLGIGARGLQIVVAKLQNEMLFDLLTNENKDEVVELKEKQEKKLERKK